MSETPDGPVTLAEVDATVLRALEPPGRRWYLSLALFATIVAGGGLLLWLQVRRGMVVTGLNSPVGWGTYITNFVFWVGIAHSGTLISAILLLFRARWRTAIYRCAEAMTVFAVMTAGLFPLIHLGRIWVFYFLLPYPNERGLWPNFTSPLVWDMVAIATYFTVSSVFLYIGMVPDLAVVRDRAQGWRRRVYGLLAAGWRGTDIQYRHYGRAYLLFAALATPLVISVHSVVSFDFATGILPGWHSTIFPPYFVAGAIHSGLAMVLALLVPLRRSLGLERLITIDHFDKGSQLLLLTTAIVGYAYVVEPWIAWYSGDVFERELFLFRAFGELAPEFWVLTFANVVLPLSLIFRRARRSLGWLLVIGVGVNIGMWLERYVIVVSSTAHDFLPGSFGSYRPSLVEIGLTVASFAWFLLLFVGFTRLLPPVAIAELKAELGEEEEA